MKRLLSVAFLTAVLWVASYNQAFAESYTIPILVDGQPITLTLTITDDGNITVTSPLTGVVVGEIAPIVELPARQLFSSGTRAKPSPNALDQMITHEDEFSDVTFYMDKRTQFVTESFLYPYIVKGDDSVWLRLYINYRGQDDWLFVRKYTVLTDGKRWEIAPDWDEFERTNERTLLWEWVDLLAASENIRMLQAIAKSEDAKIRYHGETYVYDRVISLEEKDIITTVLAAFKLLGGELDK